MIEREVEYLEGDVTVTEREPTTYAEAETVLGSEIAVVKTTVDNLRYRNKHPRVYRRASKDLESTHPRAVRSEKKLPDGSIKRVLESELDHLRAAFKAHPEKTTDVIAHHALNEPLYVRPDRAGIGGKLSSKVISSANTFFAEGEERVEEVVTQIESLLPSYKVERDSDSCVTPMSLARGIAALQRHLERDSQQRVDDALAPK